MNFKLNDRTKKRLLKGTINKHGPFGIGVHIAEITDDGARVRITMEDRNGKVLGALDDMTLPAGDTLHVQNIVASLGVIIS